MFQTWSGPPTDRDEPNEPSESLRHRLLASPQRRIAIDVLADRSDPIAVTDLAAAMVTRAEEMAAEPVGEERRTAVRLHHCHLPMLDEAGMVDYDPTGRRADPAGSSLDAIR